LPSAGFNAATKTSVVGGEPTEVRLDETPGKLAVPLKDPAVKTLPSPYEMAMATSNPSVLVAQR